MPVLLVIFVEADRAEAMLIVLIAPCAFDFMVTDLGDVDCIRQSGSAISTSARSPNADIDTAAAMERTLRDPCTRLRMADARPRSGAM